MSVSLAKPLANTEQKNSELQVRLSRWLTIILLLLAAWILGSLVWKFIFPVQPLTPWKPVIQQLTQQDNTTSSQVDIQSVANSNIFGLYTEQPVAPSQTNAPETKLNLTLVGVVASSNSEKSLAVIANRGQQMTYGVDETIEGTGATLVSVLPDRVIISNRGNQEALMLEGLDYTEQVSPVSTNSVEDSQTINVNSDELDEIRTSIMEDPQKAFQYIRLSQRMVDGQLQGYQVRPGNNRILFDAAGLQDGDVAVEMNGKDLTDPSQMTELWAEAAAADSWDLTVERDGQLHQIYISF